MGVVNRMEGDKKDVSSKQPHSVADSNGSSVPITPIVDRQNGDSRIESSRVNSICKENDSKVDDVASSIADDFSASTIIDSVADNGSPVAHVFDSFAHGPEILERAPMCKKKNCHDLSCSVAQINFNLCLDDDDDVGQK